MYPEKLGTGQGIGKGVVMVQFDSILLAKQRQLFFIEPVRAMGVISRYGDPVMFEGLFQTATVKGHVVRHDMLSCYIMLQGRPYLVKGQGPCGHLGSDPMHLDIIGRIGILRGPHQYIDLVHNFTLHYADQAYLADAAPAAVGCFKINSGKRGFRHAIYS